MKNGRDVAFKIGLGLQLVLIPAALLWRFSQEDNYYNWIIAACVAAVIGLSLWPQTIVVRMQRLAAIKTQALLVAPLLICSWLAYFYFRHYVQAHAGFAIYSVNWESLFGRRWVMLLGQGIGLGTAALFSALFIALPVANLYRYQLDKRRIKGIKKEDLFV